MEKAIFYKEWIKTRRLFIASALLSLCFVIYCILRINRVVDFKGVAHLWGILLTKDSVFIEPLQYVPLFIGILIALSQFVPEMQQNRLKLTLHLPYAHQRMTLMMLTGGLTLILSIFIVNYAILGIYLSGILAPELWGRILLTALPWYLCGVCAYLLTTWTVLEPTWKRRIINALISAGVLRVFFLSPSPQAYDGFIPVLVLLTVGITGFSLLSVARFKAARQD